RPALEKATKLLADSDSETVVRAALVIGTIGPPAASAVPALVRVLRDAEDDPLRGHLASALGNIGPDAKDGEPALVETLDHVDPDDFAEHAIIDALRKIGPATAAGRAAVARSERRDKLREEASSRVAAINRPEGLIAL